MTPDPIGFDWKALATGLVGVLVGILSWIGKHQLNKYDEQLAQTAARHDELAEKHDRHVDRFNEITAVVVTRHELEKTMTTLRDDRQRMHVENQEKLDDQTTKLNDIRDSTTATHRRIDDMYRDLLNRKQ